MGYSYDFKNNETYDADDINAVRAGLIGSGVLGFGSSACSASVSENAVTVSGGEAVFADGSRIVIDQGGVSLALIPDVKNYVYLFNDTVLNKNTVCISQNAPSGDYIAVAEIAADGTLTDKRTFAVAKFSALGTQSYYIAAAVNGSTNSWSKQEWNLVGTLNVPQNLRTVIVLEYVNLTRSFARVFFIGSEDTVIEYNNSGTGSSTYLKITPDFKLYVKCNDNITVPLIFTNYSQGTISYA